MLCCLYACTVVLAQCDSDASATPASTTGMDVGLQLQWMEASSILQPNPCLDVFYTRALAADAALRQLLFNKLDALARAEYDRPVPQYVVGH